MRWRCRDVANICANGERFCCRRRSNATQDNGSAIGIYATYIHTYSINAYSSAQPTKCDTKLSYVVILAIRRKAKQKMSSSLEVLVFNLVWLIVIVLVIVILCWMSSTFSHKLMACYQFHCFESKNEINEENKKVILKELKIVTN